MSKEYRRWGILVVSDGWRGYRRHGRRGRVTGDLTEVGLRIVKGITIVSLKKGLERDEVQKEKEKQSF